jgi:hypothetical protein
MAKKYHFTDAMLNELKKLYPHTLSAHLAEKYNCSLSAIYYQANKLGVKKTKEFIAETSRAHSSRPDHGGRKTRFRKGTVPPNKGKKQTEFMSKEAIEKTKATRFRKGLVPHNHKPIGYERINRDGYIEVKVRDEKYTRNFELKHRLIWEKHFGPIPESHNIQFKDGNKLNCKIENLYMISRADQVATENSIHRYPDELKRAIRLTTKLKKQIKEHEQTN